MHSTFAKISFFCCTFAHFFLSAEGLSQETSSSVPAPPVLGIQIVTNAASLQVLDKITGNMSIITVKINETITFGTLRICVRHCQKNAPEDVPESKAFVEILEETTEATPLTQFSNWMFSSSPSLSTLEHPVYGVWVKECLDVPGVTIPVPKQ